MGFDLSILSQIIVDGLIVGLLYALVGLGITLIYGLSGIVNFAQGELMIVGALIAWSVHDRTGSFGLALVAAVAAMCVTGFILERLAFQFTLSEPVTGFIVSLGLIIAIQGAIFQIWGPGTHSAEPPLEGAFNVAGVSIEWQDLFNSGLAVSALAAFYCALTWTKVGKALRAMSDDREAASLVGIPVKAIVGFTFTLSVGLAGLAGWIALTRGLVSPGDAGIYVLRGFAAALIGGLGSIHGTVAAGVMLGVAESLSVGYGDPAWRDLYVFGLVIVVLLWRPTGLARGAQGVAL